MKLLLPLLPLFFALTLSAQEAFEIGPKDTDKLQTISLGQGSNRQGWNGGGFMQGRAQACGRALRVGR